MLRRNSGAIRTLGGRSPPQVGSSARLLFARCLERVGKSTGGVGDSGVGGHDICHAVAAASCVELLDRSVELCPELVGTAPAGAGPELVRRPRAVGASARRGARRSNRRSGEYARFREPGAEGKPRLWLSLGAAMQAREAS
jgi:hypothetical protein